MLELRFDLFLLHFIKIGLVMTSLCFVQTVTQAKAILYLQPNTYNIFFLLEKGVTEIILLD